MKSDRREKIRSAARMLHNAHGDIYKVSVAAIAEAVGCSVGAFYLSYKTKEELFAELLREDLAEGFPLATVRRYLPSELAAVV